MTLTFDEAKALVFAGVTTIRGFQLGLDRLRAMEFEPSKVEYREDGSDYFQPDVGVEILWDGNRMISQIEYYK